MIIIDINGNKRECVSVSPDDKWPGYMRVEYVSKIRKGHKHSEWYPKKDFIRNNPELEHLVKGISDPWKEDLGAVSLASNQTLTDKTKKWKSNEFPLTEIFSLVLICVIVQGAAFTIVTGTAVPSSR